jgi:hypothetical protein
MIYYSVLFSTLVYASIGTSVGAVRNVKSTAQVSEGEQIAYTCPRAQSTEIGRSNIGIVIARPVRLLDRHPLLGQFSKRANIPLGCNGQAQSSGTTAFCLTQEQSKKAGKLIGRVTRGPTSPVEGDDSPQPQPVSEAKVVISDSDGREIETVITDKSGNYSANLPHGTYDVALLSEKEKSNRARRVTIVEGQITRLDIRIDTGVR